jgi:hypothetical protein
MSCARHRLRLFSQPYSCVLSIRRLFSSSECFWVCIYHSKVCVSVTDQKRSLLLFSYFFAYCFVIIIITHTIFQRTQRGTEDRKESGEKIIVYTFRTLFWKNVKFFSHIGSHIGCKVCERTMSRRKQSCPQHFKSEDDMSGLIESGKCRFHIIFTLPQFISHAFFEIIICNITRKLILIS